MTTLEVPSEESSKKDSLPVAHARQAGLRYVSDVEPGIRRQRRGKKFQYLDSRGKTIRDKATLARIAALAIPPAYHDVWICESERGHLQATGRDARGRKQYRYHTRWRSVRDRDKFGRVVDFGERLPALRRRLRRDLVATGLGRDKVLAIVVSVMIQTLLRVGNIAYAKSNGSYGLTTLRKRHIAFIRNGRAMFRFRGKSGIENTAALDDQRLTRLLRRCKQLPGQALFQYTGEDSHAQPVDSGMVNDYLRDAMGEEFTAKDFRTWGGTCAAVAVLAATPLPKKESERASKIVEAVKTVANTLRNTPAVCRNSYIHPIVFTAWGDGGLHRAIETSKLTAASSRERAVLSFLRRRLRQK